MSSRAPHRPLGKVEPQRGEIWEVDFAPTIGAKIQKSRPALVLNENQVGRLPLRIVVPITDWDPRYAALRWLVPLQPVAGNGLHKPSAADCFQIKSLSLQRFKVRLGALSEQDVEEIATTVALIVGAP